jgi:anti-anti-sigma factor
MSMSYCAEDLRRTAVLRIDLASCDHAALVVCSGRVVEGDGAETLRNAVMSQPGNQILVDLSRVKTMDARGLGILVELKKWAEREGKTLQLLNPSARVLELLQRTRLNSVLDICRSTRERGHAA